MPIDTAFTLWGSALSRPRPDQCATAATSHARSITAIPGVKGIEGASVMFLSDEHATITLPPDSPIAVGDRIELWPSHIDPTINLHDVMYAVSDGEVVQVWPIAARGYPEQRR